MPFPNYKDKYSSGSVFTPEDFKHYRARVGDGVLPDPPEKLILCYSPYIMDYVKREYDVIQDERRLGAMCGINTGSGIIWIRGGFGIGAPGTVAVAEETIALGARRIISIGMAGTLQKDLPIGALVVCDKAIRDEGTSYHYLKPSKYAHASPEITEIIKAVLDRQGHSYMTGTSWTIDAPYRETVDEVRQYQQEGVVTVEMEASALFAVAEYRSVQIGAIFTISDSLAELEWSPEFHSEEAEKGVEIICRAAIEALSG